jgi:putative phosphoribosyl transferase
MIFYDRQDAGQKLAILLKKYKKAKDTIVVGLPRGGVITAFEVAKYLDLSLDVICPRKIGAPFNPELAIGAITHSGALYLNEDIVQQLGISRSYIEKESADQRRESERRMQLFRKNRPPLESKDKTIILVDDGLATGATMKAALFCMRALGAKKIVCAVPVGPRDSLFELQQLADEVFCLYTPDSFMAVGQFYTLFNQTTDDEVIELLSFREFKK